MRKYILYNNYIRNFSQLDRKTKERRRMLLSLAQCRQALEEMDSKEHLQFQLSRKSTRQKMESLPMRMMRGILGIASSRFCWRLLATPSVLGTYGDSHISHRKMEEVKQSVSKHRIPDRNWINSELCCHRCVSNPLLHHVSYWRGSIILPRIGHWTAATERSSGCLVRRITREHLMS